MKPIAIIGGGITGLTAAYRLRERGLPVVVYEAGGRTGGVIQSERQNGFLAEFGPNSILETSPLITDLVSSLGLDRRKEYSNPAAENRFVVRGGVPRRLPSSPLRFFTSSFFSASAKMRLLTEPFTEPAEEDLEESVEEFVLRRLGREFLDYAINPMVGGIYAGDPARLSVKYAFPKLHALEQKYGSLILGQLFGARERKRRGEVSKQSAKKFSFDEGLQVLTSRLAAKLGEQLKLHSPVTRITRAGDAWELTIGEGHHATVTRHPAILLAAPAHKMAGIQLLGAGTLDLSALSFIYHPPVASIVLGFRRDEVRHPLNGFGMLVPEVEGFNILGTLFSSTLFENRAPEGFVTLTSYLGGARAPELALATKEEAIELTLRDLRNLLGISGKPAFQHYAQFKQAIPQYNLGYGCFKDFFEEVEKNAPGIFMAGHYRDGISLGDSIVSAHHVVERMHNYLGRLGVASSADTTFSRKVQSA